MTEGLLGFLPIFMIYLTRVSSRLHVERFKRLHLQLKEEVNAKCEGVVMTYSNTRALVFKTNKQVNNSVGILRTVQVQVDYERRQVGWNIK